LVPQVPGKACHIKSLSKGVLPTAGYDSHSSANFLEWFLFSEDQCVPSHILTVKAFEDRRTDGNDAHFKG
jgi:hypothetical protein